MQKFHPVNLIRLIVTTLLLVTVLPANTSALAQLAENSFTNDDYGVVVEWTDNWIVDPEPLPNDTVLSIERDQTAFLTVIMLDGQDLSEEAAIEYIVFDEYEVVEDRMAEDPPSLRIQVEGAPIDFLYYAYPINNGETMIVVRVGAAPVLWDTALEVINEDVTINGEPPLAGYLDSDSGDVEDLTGDTTPTVRGRTSRGTVDTTDATVEATEETSRTSRTSRGEGEEPEATEETGRTSRTSRDASETPETIDEEDSPVITRNPRTGSGTSDATEEPTDVPTEEATELATEEPTGDTGLSQQNDSFVGPVWGYSFEFNPSIWEPGETINADPIDGIRLDGESATVAFTGLDMYGADPVTCLMEENEYYLTQSDAISDWQVATDANGDDLWYESDELAWGVFTYTFHSSSGTDVEFVDYISCETIPGEDAVLIVQMTSFPDEYNNNLDAVLDILDTLEFQP